MSRKLNDRENTVIQKLGEAWNEFNDLEIIHNDDASEFRALIHAAQNMIAARVVWSTREE